MQNHSDLSVKTLNVMIKAEYLRFAGNRHLKIFGRLTCKSGKRMKKSNRVFFASKAEAIALGFRPCGHCMKKDFYEWKAMR